MHGSKQFNPLYPKHSQDELPYKEGTPEHTIVPKSLKIGRPRESELEEQIYSHDFLTGDGNHSDLKKKRMSDSLDAGDRVLAAISGSSKNQQVNGRDSKSGWSGEHDVHRSVCTVPPSIGIMPSIPVITISSDDVHQSNGEQHQLTPTALHSNDSNPQPSMSPKSVFEHQFSSEEYVSESEDEPGYISDACSSTGNKQ